MFFWKRRKLKKLIETIKRDGIIGVLIGEGRAEETANVLGKMGKKAVPALIEIVKNKGETEVVRERAIFALGYIGPRAVSAIPTLIEVLKENREARRVTAGALGDIGPLGANYSVPALMERLQVYLLMDASTIIDNIRDIVVITEIIESLEKIGPAARSSAPIIAKMRKRFTYQDAAGICQAADSALQTLLCTQGAIPDLITWLKDTSLEGETRALAAEWIGFIGSDAKTAVPSLIYALKDKDKEVRDNAAYALKIITGKDFGKAQEKWREWWKNNK